MKKYTNIEMISDGNDIRFALYRRGIKTLYLFGINPSTATDKISDRTMVKVIGFAERNDYDGFAMLNLYPLRSTNPYDLPKEINEELHLRNLSEIRKTIGEMYNPIILLAFGDSINAAPYLKRCLRDIVEILQPLCPKWKKIGNLTKKGYPRHPSRAAYSLGIQDFDVTNNL